MIPDAFVPPNPPPPVVEQRLSAAAGVAVRVTSHGWAYRVTGNTLLPPDRIETLLLQADDPQQAVSRLSEAYKQAGYPLVVVTAQIEPEPARTGASDSAAPPPSAGARSVSIRVVEGRITELQAAGALQPYFSGLRDRADVTADQVLRQAILANDYANRQGQRVQIGFSPAEQQGGSVLQAITTPLPGYKPWTAALQLGNYGSRYTSSYVAGGNIAWRPGAGWEFTGNYLAGLPNWSSDSRGSLYHAAGLGASVATPLGTYGLSVQNTTYKLGRVSYPLNTAGQVRTGSASGSQLLYASERSQLRLSESFNHVENRVSVFDGAYTLTDQRYDYLTLGLAYTRGYSLGDLGGALTGTLSYNRGLSERAGSFLLSSAATAPTPQFRSYNFGLTVQQQLPRSFYAQAVLNGQWTEDTLPQQQQWVLGGLGNLTAYNAGVAVGDKGYSLRLSLQAPAQQWGGLSLTPNLFIEHGAARYAQIQGPWQRVTDWGVGLNLALPRAGTTLNLLYARPVSSSNIAAQTLNQQRAHVFFVLQQSL